MRRGRGGGSGPWPYRGDAVTRATWWSNPHRRSPACAVGLRVRFRSARNVRVSEPIDWRQFGWTDWAEVSHVRDHLAAGADPNWLIGGDGRPLQEAARHGHPDVVAELAAAVRDVDDVYEGRTALWVAVHARRPRNARALVAAGADPWRPMMSGWSPGRLSLA